MKDKKKIIGSIVISVLFGICIFVGYNIPRNSSSGKSDDIFIESNNNENLKKDNNSSQKNVLDDNHKKIHIYVKGAVKEHRAYSITMEYGSLYEDAVKASGGLTEDADMESPMYTPQKKLKDEDIVYVPKKGENIILNNNIKTSSQNKDTSIAGKLNLNTASEEEIVAKKIPRIGKATAAKIVKYRDSNGGKFNSLEELKKAVGSKTAENMMDYVDIN